MTDIVSENQQPEIVFQYIYRTYTPAVKRAILKYRANNLEKWREDERKRKYNKYHNDPEYRAKTMERQRAYQTQRRNKIKLQKEKEEEEKNETVII